MSVEFPDPAVQVPGTPTFDKARQLNRRIHAVSILSVAACAASAEMITSQGLDGNYGQGITLGVVGVIGLGTVLRNMHNGISVAVAAEQVRMNEAVDNRGEV